MAQKDCPKVPIYLSHHQSTPKVLSQKLFAPQHIVQIELVNHYILWSLKTLRQSQGDPQDKIILKASYAALQRAIQTFLKTWDTLKNKFVINAINEEM